MALATDPLGNSSYNPLKSNQPTLTAYKSRQSMSKHAHSMHSPDNVTPTSHFEFKYEPSRDMAALVNNNELRVLQSKSGLHH